MSAYRILVLSSILLGLHVAAPHAQAQSTPDLTGSLKLLGNPVQQFYSKTSDKEQARDLQVYGNRLYIGHGTTSSSQYTHVIYYDLAAKRFDYERDASGNKLTMRSELLRSMRVQDGELLLEDYDPFSRARFYRKSATGGWTVSDVAVDAHSRDNFKFGGEYFINHGHRDTKFPYVYYSKDKGASWSPIQQPEVFSGFGVVYDEFFSFKGKLYLSGSANGYDVARSYIGPTNQPFLLRYEGNGKFATAYARRSDFLNASNTDYEYVRMAQNVGKNLVFLWGMSDVYLATSIEPAQLTKVDLPAYQVTDITVHGGYAYVLMQQKSGSQYINYVYRVAEDGQVKGMFSVKLSGPASALELHNNAAYLSISGLKLYRVPVTLTSVPPPPAISDDMTLDVKVVLEGAYDPARNAMETAIKGFLDIKTAFDGLPTSAYGDAVTWDVAPEALELDLVDFVVLELRSSTSPTSKVYRRGALLMSDGRIRGFDGTSLPVIRSVPLGSYYVVVRHRNHLDVMSASKVNLTSGSGSYDFTTSVSKAYGDQSLKRMSNGVYALYTGDMNASGRIDTPDIFSVWSRQNGLGGYRGGDVDLSGFVNAFDLLKLWLPNAGRSSNVPE